MNETVSIQKKFSDLQWQAVLEKNGNFDGSFFFGVRTTGIFCRPSCSSKTPRRENVTFFASADDAERSGYRACLRCRPKDAAPPRPQMALVAKAFELLRSDPDEVPTVEDLSVKLRVAPGRLQKAFRSVFGLSPKQVADMLRLERFRENVKHSDVVTSLYDSGFGSSRSLYEKAAANLGMTPAVYKKGGKGMNIKYTITDSPLGKMLVAATEKGICSVSFGDDELSLVNELRQEFFSAAIENDGSELNNAVNAILKSLRGEKAVLDLPLDLRASAFQMRVWSELRKIPYGSTRSYAQIAEQTGNSRAVRAVARACATNPVAVITPCHRVIASDGKLRGYRWGVDRKEKLLKIEKRGG